MLTVDKPADMKAHIGEDIGTSDWVTVDQAMIDKFAEATGDHQWIHVDVERAKREMPGGKTIAHGYLTLSLLAGLAHQTLRDPPPVARHQLRFRPGALHRAGAGRVARPAAAETLKSGGHRRRRSHDLRKPDGDRGQLPPGPRGRDAERRVRLNRAMSLTTRCP